MVGLFIFTVVNVHHSDLRFNIGLFFLVNVVFLIQLFIGPIPIPSLHWYPCISAVGCMLGNFPNRNKKTEEPRCVVRLNAFCGFQ